MMLIVLDLKWVSSVIVNNALITESSQRRQCHSTRNRVNALKNGLSEETDCFKVLTQWHDVHLIPKNTRTKLLWLRWRYITAQTRWVQGIIALELDKFPGRYLDWWKYHERRTYFGANSYCETILDCMKLGNYMVYMNEMWKREKQPRHETNLFIRHLFIWANSSPLLDAHI